MRRTGWPMTMAATSRNDREAASQSLRRHDANPETHAEWAAQSPRAPLRHARLLGDWDGSTLLQQTIEEEGETDHRLTEIAEMDEILAALEPHLTEAGNA